MRAEATALEAGSLAIANVYVRGKLHAAMTRYAIRLLERADAKAGVSFSNLAKGMAARLAHQAHGKACAVDHLRKMARVLAMSARFRLIDALAKSRSKLKVTLLCVRFATRLLINRRIRTALASALTFPGAARRLSAVSQERRASLCTVHRRSGQWFIVGSKGFRECAAPLAEPTASSPLAPSPPGAPPEVDDGEIAMMLWAEESTARLSFHNRYAALVLITEDAASEGSPVAIDDFDDGAVEVDDEAGARSESPTRPASRSSAEAPDTGSTRRGSVVDDDAAGMAVAGSARAAPSALDGVPAPAKASSSEIATKLERKLVKRDAVRVGSRVETLAKALRNGIFFNHFPLLTAAEGEAFLAKAGMGVDDVEFCILVITLFSEKGMQFDAGLQALDKALQICTTSEQLMLETPALQALKEVMTPAREP